MLEMKIAELKAHLSRAVKTVRNGQEIIICDRDRPVAKIVPLIENAPAQIAEASVKFRPIHSTLTVAFDPVRGLLAERGRR